MLVTTAMLGWSLRKLPSDSSASTTISSHLPSFALLPSTLTLPPTTAVGSRPAAFSTVATIEVVVVLPWRAGDRHRVLEPHQLGEHLGPGDDGDLPRLRGEHLRVVPPDRRGDDHHVGRDQVLRPVADLQARAEPVQPARGLRLLEVRAADPVAEVEQHLGDAAHADAADAHEVHLGRVPGLEEAQPPERVGSIAAPPVALPLGPATSSAQMSTSSRAASGRPS